MEFKVLLFSVLVVSFGFSSSIVHAYEDASKVQRSIRDMVEKLPGVRQHIDDAMKLFRDKEECGTANESKRPKESKSCKNLFTYDSAVAASDADLKECQAKCKAGAAGAKPVNGKGTDAELAKCVDQACSDECTQKEALFKLELEQYLRGTITQSLKMSEEFSTKRGFRGLNSEMMIMNR